MKTPSALVTKLLPAFLIAMTTFGSAAPALYEEASRLKVGDDAPEFSVTTTEGEEFSMEDQKGKVVLVNLFATWCGPCQAEMPMLQKEVHEANAENENFTLIAFAREEGDDEVKPFGKRLGLTFPLVGDTDRAVYDSFAEGYIPRLYLIGKDGKIKFAAVGADEREVPDLLKAIEDALAEGEEETSAAEAAE